METDNLIDWEPDPTIARAHDRRSPLARGVATVCTAFSVASAVLVLASALVLGGFYAANLALIVLPVAASVIATLVPMLLRAAIPLLPALCYWLICKMGDRLG